MTQQEWDQELFSTDPLGFPGYSERGSAIGRESVRIGCGELDRQPCVLIKSDYSVFGGSMGAAAGEKICRAFRRATADGLPVVAVTRTGGARMQEGMLSLIQMPRTVAAIDQHTAAGLLSIGLLESPTTGGIYASWASLLSLRAAHRGAIVGFAGPRVVAEMTGAPPPPDSHTAESAFRAGLVDAVVESKDQGAWVRAALGLLDRPLVLPVDRPGVLGGAIGDTRDLVVRARDARRPSGLEWAAALCESWVEIKGADPAVRAGLARLSGVRCVVVVMDRHAYGDGAARPTPEGYRLAQRAAALASQQRLPVLTLVDTPGADPSPASEAAGVAREIAGTLRAFDVLPTASVSICVGEGGSGGAIALSHTDMFCLLEDAVYSVIGPEAAAVILWHDVSRAAEATTALRIDSSSIREMGISDETLARPANAAQLDALRSRVATMLSTAVVGRRWSRPDAATHRWLDEGLDTSLVEGAG